MLKTEFFSSIKTIKIEVKYWGNALFQTGEDLFQLGVNMWKARLFEIFSTPFSAQQC